MSDMAEALSLWTELTGLDPDRTRFTLGDLDVRQMSRAVQEAIDLDRDGLTAFLLLDYFVNDYFNRRSFTVNRALADYDGMLAYLAKAERLKEVLGHKDIRDAADRFEQAVIAGLTRYGADREDVLKLARNRTELAFLRRNALRSVEELRLYTFATGTPETAKPVMFDRILVATSPNALIELATSVKMPSGVALAMIRDPDNWHCYFTFVIRNGGNISLLTDRPKEAHPMARQMSRRPDRAFEKRAFAHHFPYDILGMKIDWEEGFIYFEQGDGRGLVPYQPDFAYSKYIRDCNPDEVIWISLVMDRISEKFFQRGFVAEISYTAEMIANPDRLLIAAQKNFLPMVDYRPTSLKRVTAADVTGEATEGMWGGRRTGQNDWLEQRYGDVVDEDILNLASRPKKEVHFLTDQTDGVVTLSEGDFSSREFFSRGRIEHYRLEGLDMTAFGTDAELRADQIFVARANKATLIQRAADQEFKARRDEVLAWYQERVRANLPALLGWIAAGRCEADTLDDYALRLNPDSRGGSFGYRNDNRNILGIVDLTRKDLDYTQKYLDGVYVTDWDHGLKEWPCCLTGVRPSFLARFQPQTPQALAVLAGCRVADLPDVLQHWTRETLYAGNSILDRLDPMEWKLRNPWIKLKLGVGVHLSKRGLARVRKDAGRAA